MKLFFTILLSLMTFFSFSQNWEKGYYYDLEGQKFEGQIKLHRDKTPCLLSYKGKSHTAKKMTPDQFTAFCTERDSFVVLRDMYIGDKKEKTLPINYYKVIQGDPIHGYIMYANAELNLGGAVMGGLLFGATGILVFGSGAEFSMVYLLKKDIGSFLPVFSDESMVALLEMVKDDKSVYNYLKDTGYNQGILKNAVNLYNRRNGPSKK